MLQKMSTTTIKLRRIRMERKLDNEGICWKFCSIKYNRYFIQMSLISLLIPTLCRRESLIPSNEIIINEMNTFNEDLNLIAVINEMKVGKK